MINYFLCFLLFFLFYAFSPSFKEDYCKLYYKIYSACNKEILKDKNMRLTSIGGALSEDVEKINAGYVSLDTATLEQARKLYVNVIEGYLKAYNSNKQIRPFLHNFPFTVDNIKLMIGFEDEFNRHRGDGFVALVSMPRGKIYYRTYDHDKKDFVDLHRETYEEARKLVGYQ